MNENGGHTGIPMNGFQDLDFKIHVDQSRTFWTVTAVLPSTVINDQSIVSPGERPRNSAMPWGMVERREGELDVLR